MEPDVNESLTNVQQSKLVIPVTSIIKESVVKKADGSRKPHQRGLNRNHESILEDSVTPLAGSDQTPQEPVLAEKSPLIHKKGNHQEQKSSSISEIEEDEPDTVMLLPGKKQPK